MSQSYAFLKAAQVQEILLSHTRDTDKQKRFADSAPADIPAAHALVGGLAGGQWKVVQGCARALGHAKPESASVAVDGLLKCLNHPYPEVRTEAARSLDALAFLVEIPLEPVWEAFLGEEETSAFLALGRVLVGCLRSGSPAPLAWAPKLHDLLTRIQELSLTELPLGGVVPERHIMTLAPPTSSPGIVARLMGRNQPRELVSRTDPAPRPVRPENRQFLKDLGDRYRDTPEVISLLATIYSRVPANPTERLSLVLKLCQMPLASFPTSEALVLLAASLVRDNPGKMALLASMWGWGRTYEPTWTGRLALSAAQARPDLRQPLFQFLRARQSRIDWTGWANSLREADPIDLEPLVAATLAAPESDLGGWMKLLSQAPVEHTVPALARALGSSEKAVASDALDRLLQYGQPVPWLLNDIHTLRKHWAKEAAMLKGLDTLMRLAIATPTPLPAGKRLPDLTVEWTLEDSAANPFLQGQVLSWVDGLQQLNAFYVQGGEVHLTSSAVMVSLVPDLPPLVRALPGETMGAGVTLLAAGPDGGLLFAGRGQNQVNLYLLRAGASEFSRLQPALPVDELPSPREVMWDGAGYGWSKTVEREGQVEGGLSLRKEVAYRVDAETGALQTMWSETMRPLEVAKIETADPVLSPLGFHFSTCGGYRVCDSEGLAIRTGMENPIHSQGRAEGGLALHLEVFPSRLCRVYLWQKG